jgi:hypothetical protein
MDKEGCQEEDEGDTKGSGIRFSMSCYAYVVEGDESAPGGITHHPGLDISCGINPGSHENRESLLVSEAFAGLNTDEDHNTSPVSLGLELGVVEFMGGLDLSLPTPRQPANTQPHLKIKTMPLVPCSTLSQTSIIGL